MNLSRTSAVNPNIMHLSQQDVNFESNVRAIYNIVKDQVATLQVREDMLSFVSIGEREMDAFVNSRILNIPSTEAPVSRKQLRTFRNPSKKQNKSKSHTAEKDHKTLANCLRKRIVNS